jgi:hypothetical protein
MIEGDMIRVNAFGTEVGPADPDGTLSARRTMFAA